MHTDTHTHTLTRTHTHTPAYNIVLFSSYETKCGRRELKIQRGRLNYLAPEILKELAPPCPHKGTPAITSYSTASDIYAFRYVVCVHLILILWYVILCYKSHEEVVCQNNKATPVLGYAENELRKYPAAF